MKEARVPSLTARKVDRARKSAGNRFTITSLALSFSVTTSDLTATNGDDYIGVSGTLVTFASGESTKTLDIPIIDDNAGEGEESFRVELKLHGPSRPSAALGSNSQMTVIIEDNDGVMPTTPQGLYS